MNVNFSTGSYKAVWLVLVIRANVKGECWPSIERISRDASVSKATVYRALAEFERLGLVRKKKRPNVTTVYVLQNFRISQQGSHRETQRKREPIMDVSSAAKRDMDRARAHLRRSQVKSTFLAFCVLHEPGEIINAPMLSRELGIPVSKVKSDMLALIKNLDIPVEEAMRFGNHKRKPWHAGRLKNAMKPFRSYDR